jgi:alkyldihydroxyacetonephosphate synthase
VATTTGDLLRRPIRTLGHERFCGFAQLVLAFESADHELQPWMQRAAQICAEHGGRVNAEALQGVSAPQAGHSGAAGRWRDFFVRGPYYKEGYTRMGVMRETFETACTWSAFPELHARVVEETTKAAKRECGDGVVACRFTHVYPVHPRLPRRTRPLLHRARPSQAGR